MGVRSLLSWPGLIRTVVSNVRLSVRLLREPRVPLVRKAVLVFRRPVFHLTTRLHPRRHANHRRGRRLRRRAARPSVFLQLCPPEAVAYHRAAIAQGHRFTRMPASGPVIDAEFRRQD